MCPHEPLDKLSWMKNNFLFFSWRTIFSSCRTFSCSSSLARPSCAVVGGVLAGCSVLSGCSVLFSSSRKKLGFSLLILLMKQSCPLIYRWPLIPESTDCGTHNDTGPCCELHGLWFVLLGFHLHVAVFSPALGSFCPMFQWDEKLPCLGLERRHAIQDTGCTCALNYACTCLGEWHKVLPLSVFIWFAHFWWKVGS